MTRKFAAFDIDGTLLRWQLFHTIVREVAEATGIKPPEYLEAQRLFADWKRRANPQAFAEYEHAVVMAWFAMIENTSVEQYNQGVETAFAQQKDYIYTYTRDLLTQLREQGYYTIAISGSHQEVVDKMREQYGFDYAIGARYGMQDGKFTGERTTPITDKGAVLRQVVAEQDLDWRDSYAVGDSGGDAKMLELVTHPIAFNPDQRLLDIALESGWSVVIERKNVVYQLAKGKSGYELQR